MNTYIAKIHLIEGSEPAYVAVKAKSQAHASIRCHANFRKRGLPQLFTKHDFHRLDESLIVLNDLEPEKI